MDCNPKVMFPSLLKAVRRTDKAKSALKIIISYNNDEELGITLATEKKSLHWDKSQNTDLLHEEERIFFFFNQANLNHCRGNNLKIKPDLTSSLSFSGVT